MATPTVTKDRPKEIGVLEAPLHWPYAPLIHIGRAQYEQAALQAPRPEAQLGKEVGDDHPDPGLARRKQGPPERGRGGTQPHTTHKGHPGVGVHTCTFCRARFSRGLPPRTVKVGRLPVTRLKMPTMAVIAGSMLRLTWWLEGEGLRDEPHTHIHGNPTCRVKSELHPRG